MTPKKCMFIAKFLTDHLHVELEPLWNGSKIYSHRTNRLDQGDYKRALIDLQPRAVECTKEQAYNGNA